MTPSKNVRHNLRGLRPLYAALGATDLAVQRLRELGAQAAGHDVNDAGGKDVDRLLLGARRVPGLVIDQAVTTLTRTQEQYDGFADRGARLARRQQQQNEAAGAAGAGEAGSAAESPRTRLHQAGENLARGRRVAGAAVSRTRAAATTTLRTARSEADQVLEAVTDAGRAPQPARPEPAASSRPAVPRRRRPGAADAARPTTVSNPRPVHEPAAHHPGIVPAGSGVEAGSTARRVRTGPTAPTPAARTSAAPRPAPRKPAGGPTPPLPGSLGTSTVTGPASPPMRRRPPRRATSTAASTGVVTAVPGAPNPPRETPTPAVAPEPPHGAPVEAPNTPTE